MEMQTRAGITPNENGLPFDITTGVVENYIQKKIEVAVSKANDTMRNGPDADKRRPYTFDASQVRVYTTEAGKRFVPFVIALPIDAVKGNRQNNNNNRGPSIFNPKDDDRTVSLIEPIFRALAPYMFNDQDEHAFFSDDWCRARGVERGTRIQLKNLRTAKISKFDNGRMQLVMFMIDPLRVFHDMLTMNDNNQGFRVEVTGWNKIKSGEYKYHLKRTLNKKGNFNKDRIADEIANKIRAGR